MLSVCSYASILVFFLLLDINEILTMFLDKELFILQLVFELDLLQEELVLFVLLLPIVYSVIWVGKLHRNFS